MSETSKPGSAELTELMGRVLEADASEAFGQFMVRHMALSDLAPSADQAVLDGVEESPDGGAAMAEAHLAGLSEDARDGCSSARDGEPGAGCTRPRSALLAAVSAARLPVDVTPEMVAVAAITELGDS